MMRNGLQRPVAEPHTALNPATMNDSVSPNNPTPRPRGMTTLLVLSFANACLSILGYFLFFISIPGLKAMLSNGSLEEMATSMYGGMEEDMVEQSIQLMEKYIAVSPWYYIAMALLFAVSLMGVVRMFKLNKMGFHFYTVSQILMLIANSICIYPIHVGRTLSSDLLLTLIFIAVYYISFKRIETKQ